MNLFEILLPCFVKGYVFEFACGFDVHSGERYIFITVGNSSTPNKNTRLRIDLFSDDFLNDDAENYFCKCILDSIRYLNPKDYDLIKEYSSKSPEDKINFLYCNQDVKEVLHALLDDRREHGPFCMDMVKAGKKFQRDLKEGLTG